MAVGVMAVRVVSEKRLESVGAVVASEMQTVHVVNTGVGVGAVLVVSPSVLQALE